MRIPPSLANRLLGRAASSLDLAVVRAATWRMTRTTKGAARISRLTHDERLAALTHIHDLYDDPQIGTSTESFFPSPTPIAPSLRHVRDLAAPGFGAVYDASWPSQHVPLSDEIRDKYLAHDANRTAHARLFLAREPRPVVVAIHGYMTGQYPVEERAFPVRWMRRRGFDVALVVLPFHALRARTDRVGSPPFPGADPRFTIEGCRQAVSDIRGLIAYLRRRGAPSVGVMGISLGGYMTSLLATLEDDLAFAVPIIPLASFADFARDQGRLGEGVKADAQYTAFENALRVVSPFARPSKLTPDRVLVLAAAHDRVTPKAHAERLAAHFGARLVVFPGGHLLPFGRADAFRDVGRFWRALGLAPALAPAGDPLHRVA